MPRNRASAPQPRKPNGTYAAPAQLPPRRPGITIPVHPQRPPRTASRMSDSPSPPSSAEAIDSGPGAKLRTPPLATPLFPPDLNNPRHPLAAMGPDLRRVNLGRMPQPFGPMIRADQLGDMPDDWESGDSLDAYLMDYFRKNGLHQTAEAFAADSGVGADEAPGVDTETGLLAEIWQVFWRAMVHRHPELAACPPPHLRHRLQSSSASPSASIPSTIQHDPSRPGSTALASSIPVQLPIPVGVPVPTMARLMRGEAASPPQWRV